MSPLLPVTDTANGSLHTVSFEAAISNQLVDELEDN